MAARIRARRESGVAAVEFALVSLLLVTLLFGILQYGFYFWARSSAAAAVREGARRVSVGDYPACTGPLSLSEFVQNEVGAARGGNAVTTTRTFENATGNTDPNGEVGDLMILKVSFQSLDVGFIPLPQGGVVSTTAVSRVESVKTPSPGPC